MIIVRDVFRLKFGKAREAQALIEESKKLPVQFGTDGRRVLTDLVGPSYTLVLETNPRTKNFKCSWILPTEKFLRLLAEGLV